MGCCGNKNKSAQLEYEVTLNNGDKSTVKTLAEARLAINVGGGGSYRAVPVKPAAK